MKKQTVFDSVNVQHDGQLNLRLAKQIVDDDGTVISNHWVRVPIMPGDNVEETLKIVNAAVDGFAPIDRGSLSLLFDVCSAVHTKERVASFRASVALPSKS